MRQPHRPHLVLPLICVLLLGLAALPSAAIPTAGRAQVTDEETPPPEEPDRRDRQSDDGDDILVVIGAGPDDEETPVSDDEPDSIPIVEIGDDPIIDLVLEQDPGEEETPGPLGAGQVVIRSTDEDGNRLPGACYLIVELGFELCDDDGDGDVVFDGVPPGAYTVVETAAPPDYLGNADILIEVGEDGGRFRVPHERAGGPAAGPAKQAPWPSPSATRTATRSAAPASPSSTAKPASRSSGATPTTAKTASSSSTTCRPAPIGWTRR